MKLSLLALVCILTLSCSEKPFYGEEADMDHDDTTLATNEVPEPVKQALASRFSDASSVEWTREGEVFEAAFKTTSHRYEAAFSSEGLWLETKHRIKTSELPQVVSVAILSAYRGFAIEEAEVVESVEKGKLYEVEIENEDGDDEIKKDIVVDEHGTILSEDD